MRKPIASQNKPASK